MKGYAGYTFPNMPEKWSRDDRMFGLALRGLFDTIFSDQQTQDRNTESNGTRITETNTKFDKEVKRIDKDIAAANSRMDGIDDLLNDTIERLDENIDRLTELLAALGEAFNIIYPVGMTVLTDSADPPFPFGTWISELVDPDTLEPVADSDGHYRWQRVVDE